MDRSVFYGKKWDFTMEVVFYRLDKAMRDEKLYLKPGITLSALADMAGTNRTYASRAICAKYRNFKEYINGLRIECLLRDIHDGNYGDLDAEDEDDFALRYGFRNRRSLDRILAKETGCTFKKLLRRRKKVPRL